MNASQLSSLLDLLMLSRVPSREESLTTCLRNAQEWVNSQLGMIHGKPYLSSSFSLALLIARKAASFPSLRTILLCLKEFPDKM